MIEAWSSADLHHWIAHAAILAAPTHQSYPNVFELDGEIYLVPESKAAGGVTLYGFDDFPQDPRPVRQLLSDAFNDPTPDRHDDHWYLFATSVCVLELFVADDILTGTFRPHPIGVIEPDIRHARCGGPILSSGGRLLCPAQNSRRRYGGGLDLHEIVRLTPTDYAERRARSAILPRDLAWDRAGGHHLSTVTFDGQTIYVVDGQGWAPFHHRLSVRIGTTINRLRQGYALGHS